MKYGSELSRRSVPEWKAHNIDYNEIKGYIKKATVKGSGDNSEAIAKLLEVLDEEYEAVNLFVRSKSGEIDRRIDDCEKIVDALAEQEESSLKSGLGYSLNSKVRQGKLFRLHQAITRYAQRNPREAGNNGSGQSPAAGGKKHPLTTID